MKKIITLVTILSATLVNAKTLDEYVSEYDALVPNDWNSCIEFIKTNKEGLMPYFNDWNSKGYNKENTKVNSVLIKLVFLDYKSGEKKLKPNKSILINYPDLYARYYPEDVDNILKTGKLEGKEIGNWELTALALASKNDSYLSKIEINKNVLRNQEFVNWKLNKLIMSSDLKSAYDEAINLDNILSSALLSQPNDSVWSNLLKKVQNIEDQIYIKLSRQNKLN